ncbi:MAG: 3-phosphoserine/phosphohydroxythreonine transaminase [Dethiobacter sp.]|jgi:phosphoserine aminotransferase|nr:3-phosphoserine/phosphohydroxythreonine transaminase [Dethiobacter sp.]
MTERVYNFNPGPAVLPLSVLEQARDEFLNYAGTGMSVMEISHRSKQFEAIVHSAEAGCKELLGAGDDFRVLFIQGGASMQFSMVPLNFLPAGRHADYLLTGSFAEKAWQEAQKLGQAQVAGSTWGENYRRVPDKKEINFSDNAAYVHITTNNTIYGTQWHSLPDTGSVPLVADMSSDILSRPIDINKFSLIYAGAQKNLGPSGVTVVLIRRDMLEKAPAHLTSMLRYDTYAENDSLYNTPPTFGIYMIMLVLDWIEESGGLAAMEKHNTEKAGYIYDAIDNSNGFYSGHAEKGSRSLMNITFRLAREELEKQFLAEAATYRLSGLKGHRSVGGMRASVYNAMSKTGCAELADFMESFRKKNS